MKIAVASDHAGYRYKEAIKRHLHSLSHEVQDFGCSDETVVDYPKFIYPAANAVSLGECDRGIFLGGSGNGEAIVGNRVAGVRCVVCWDLRSARFGREHNDANAIAIGQRMVAIEEALEIVDVWLSTSFAGGRHLARITQIDARITDQTSSPFAI